MAASALNTHIPPPPGSLSPRGPRRRPLPRAHPLVPGGPSTRKGLSNFLDLGLRLISVVNLELDSGALGHVGGGVALPVYLTGTWHGGWYVGPHASVTSVPSLGGMDLTLGVEGGPRWALTDRLSLNLALQVGASRLVRPDGSRWVQHLGVYPSRGVWL